MKRKFMLGSSFIKIFSEIGMGSRNSITTWHTELQAAAFFSSLRQTPWPASAASKYYNKNKSEES
jgi:hypothetical protein